MIPFLGRGRSSARFSGISKTCLLKIFFQVNSKREIKSKPFSGANRSSLKNLPEVREGHYGFLAPVGSHYSDPVYRGGGRCRLCDAVACSLRGIQEILRN